jgi:small conductance mechanosensitive channel
MSMSFMTMLMAEASLPPPAPPLDGIDTSNIKIDFLELEFWFSMLSGAIKVCINIVVAAFLLLIFTIVISIILKVLRTAVNNPRHPMPEQLGRLIIALVKLVLWIQIIPIVVNRVGIAVDSVVAVVTAIALTIGMSLRPQAENVVAGVALMLNAPCKEGDMVCFAGVKGKCHNLGLALTTIAQSTGELVHIPNMKVFSAPMDNYSAQERQRIDVDFHVLPSADVKELRKIILKTLNVINSTKVLTGNDPLVLAEPPPVMILKDVTQTSLKVTARVWVEPDKMFSANFPIREALHDALAEKGVLAFWRTSVGQTLEQLEDVGFPGLAGTGRKGHSQRSGPGADNAEADSDMVQMAIVST